MTANDQNPYEPPQAPSANVPTASAQIANKPPWRIWKRLCLFGLALAAPSLPIVFVFDWLEKRQDRHFTGPLFAVAMFFVTCSGIGFYLVILFGPVWLIQSVLRFMRSRASAPRTRAANLWLAARCVVGILVISVFIYLWYAYWEAWRP